MAMEKRVTGFEEGLVIKRERVKFRGMLEVLRCSRMCWRMFRDVMGRTVEGCRRLEVR